MKIKLEIEGKRKLELEEKKSINIFKTVKAELLMVKQEQLKNGFVPSKRNKEKIIENKEKAKSRTRENIVEAGKLRAAGSDCRLQKVLQKNCENRWKNKANMLAYHNRRYINEVLNEIKEQDSAFHSKKKFFCESWIYFIAMSLYLYKIRSKIMKFKISKFFEVASTNRLKKMQKLVRSHIDTNREKLGRVDLNSSVLIISGN